VPGTASRGRDPLRLDRVKGLRFSAGDPPSFTATLSSPSGISQILTGMRIGIRRLRDRLPDRPAIRQQSSIVHAAALADSADGRPARTTTLDAPRRSKGAARWTSL
jgi:hypothetical protein